MDQIEQDALLKWVSEAGAEVIAQERLQGEVWVDCYSDHGFGRLLSFGLRHGKVSELHLEGDRLAHAKPVYPLRLVLTPEGQDARAGWLREQSWDLARH
jgi:hypothetical protein